MKFKELSRKIESGEVISSYTTGNLTIHLTSRFNNKFALEDAMYQIIQQQLRSHKELEGRQDVDGNLDKKIV